ncbi:hypothetical protein [Bartonella acomydis]|uniref:Uncharacterized protein n=1 Tax=Bartonella acomydis TaxID=686234 RepID=A0ABP9MS82_9HYPH
MKYLTKLCPYVHQLSDRTLEADKESYLISLESDITAGKYFSAGQRHTDEMKNFSQGCGV